MNIYVGNMSFEMTEGDLRQAFEAYGEVSSSNIIKDKFSGQSKGFGFVEMTDEHKAQSAIDGLNDTELKGRKINVNKAKPRTERSDNNRGGGGGGGGRGGFGGGGGGGNRY